MSVQSIEAFAEAIGRAASAGKAHAAIGDIGSMLAAQPEIVSAMFESLVVAAQARKPNKHRLTGFVEILGATCVELRQRKESGIAAAGRTLDRLIAQIAEAGREGAIDSELLMRLGAKLAEAKIAAAAGLRDVIENRAMADEPTDFSPADMEAAMAQVAESSGNDPFFIFSQFSELTAAMPDAPRAAMAELLLLSKTTALREAALGFLLEASPEVSGAAAQALGQMAQRGLLGPAARRYVILLRPWLAASQRAAIDAALQAAQRKPAGAAGGKFPHIEAMPATAEVREVAMSAPDGAGAQSAFLVLKSGRKFCIASIMVKHGFGVRDVLVMKDVSKAKAEAFLAGMDEEIGAFDASLPTLRRLLAHGLAENLASGEPPPFGLVEVLELSGMAQVEPHLLDAGAATARLLEAIPAAGKTEAARAAAVQRSKSWSAIYQFADSWFEVSDASAELLAAAKTKKRRVDLILEQLLPKLSHRWAGQLAWTADALREDTPDGDWRDMALTADALLAGVPPRDIPLMRHIAELTEMAGRSTH